MKLSGLKGALFEIIVLKLVLMSGYKLIDSRLIDGINIKKTRNRFFEFKGRGEYHQVDIPVELIYQPSFTYPFRLLGETKYYEKKLDKSFIRQEIGKMKDIQENYFVFKTLSPEDRRRRRIEVFAFFAANGFNLGAEKLAYAHGIRTISFENNYCLKSIVRIIDYIARELERLPELEQKEILDWIYDYFVINSEALDFNDSSFISWNVPESGVIKTSIIGTTLTGLIVQFLSFDVFPDYLFIDKDYEYCRIRSLDGKYWYAEINNSDFKLYFSMPEIVLKECFIKDGNRIYPKKAHEFESIFFGRKIRGISRQLELKFDFGWFDTFLS